MFYFLQFWWILYLKLKHRTCKLHCVSISRNVELEERVTLDYGTHINAKKIGRYTFINKYSLIDGKDTEIGRFCSIAYNVKIGLGNHPSNWVSSHPFAYQKKYGIIEQNRPFEEAINQTTIIGHDVWIGANATILKGVKVGNGAIIGANALVTKDVEPYSIVIGMPAKHHRYRFEEATREKLLKMKWWDWKVERIKKEVKHFDKPSHLFDHI